MTGKHIDPAHPTSVLLLEPLLTNHRLKFHHVVSWLQTHDLVQMFVWQNVIQQWHHRRIFRNHVVRTLNLNWHLGSVSIGIWSRSVLSLSNSSPNRAPHQSFILCTCWSPSTISCQRWRESEGGRRRGRKEGGKAGGSKRNLLFLSQKSSSAKHLPTQNKSVEIKLNFTVGFPMKDTRQQLCPPKSHTQCTFCLFLKLKHPWFKVHSVVREGEWDGKRKGEGVAWGQHVEVMQHVGI